MLSDELRAFLRDGLDVQLATRDAGLKPHGTRICALRVDADGTHVEVFAPKAGVGTVLDNLRANGRVALMCSRASDSRTLQLKGSYVSHRPAKPSERAFVAAQWALFEQDLTRLGLPTGILATWTMWPSVVVRVRVEQVYEQTPGPGAGAAIA